MDNTGQPTRKEALDHLDQHVTYPATKQDIVAACNNMEDVPETDREWVKNTLPEGRYENTTDVKKALGLQE